MSEKIRVLLADDHVLVRRGFRRILEDEPSIEVVGEASDGKEAVSLVERTHPHVVVMDLYMPEMDGVQATMEIKKRHPGTSILVLSMYSDANYVRNALSAGATGYMLKNAIEVDLVAGVREVAAGRRYFSPGINIPDGTEVDDLDKLTQRERQVLQLIAQGKSTREIATLLNLSPNTVAVHRANLMQALGIHRTAELVSFAIRKGLAPLP
jgi:DNA-binding NarL/FixJ family response regulator